MTLIEIFVRYAISGIAAWVVLFLYACMLYAKASPKEAIGYSVFRDIYNRTEVNQFFKETPIRTVIWFTVWPYGVIHCLDSYVKLLSYVKNETLKANRGQ